MASVVAVVLAGGSSRRWGGVDKTATDLDGAPLLVHVARGLPPAVPVVVVGPPDHPAARSAELAAAIWTREDPPGGGPVAGLAAACTVLPAAATDLVLLAGDQPFAVPRLLDRLSTSGADVVLGVDPDGRVQPLLAAYRVPPLCALLSRDDTEPAGRSLRWVLSGLRQVLLPVTAREAFDLDAPDDLGTARALLREPAGPGPAAPQTAPRT